jgi:phosphatidate cytidylyltransferase
MKNELTKRIIFGAIAAAIALSATLYSPLTFYALVLVAALLMYAEWLELTKDSPMLNRFGGLIYVGLPVWSMIALRGTESAAHILALFALVWGTDIAAYVVGKRYGKHTLWPSISPNKTWEGLGGAILCAAIIGAVASMFVSFPTSIMQGLMVGTLIAIIAQAGDFFESWLKRRSGLKDSGNLIPGHGGILDRVDGLVFAAPAYALMLLLMGAA